ncbi:VF530 family protein [Shewanella marina]|uniref:VF530 family protein n=1 Tax=Shewanella marina TaxID=487319 RepID=UPI0004710A69|nr:VF530 family protein [Shewanella marina]
MTQKNNPLHGITLETLVTELVAIYGWHKLGEKIDIRCFTHDPSVKSSLKFLRKTPWAREKVEYLYLKTKGFQLPQVKPDTVVKPRATATKSNAASTTDVKQVNAHIWGNKAD